MSLRERLKASVEAMDQKERLLVLLCWSDMKLTDREIAWILETSLEEVQHRRCVIRQKVLSMIQCDPEKGC
jgi:DNA-directed RNA polymerase specialized sigma subunit